MTSVAIGQALRRTEDRRFLTGKGKYIDDINLEGQVRAAILRSPHAHAKINNIDTSEAKALNGVLLVITGKEWVDIGMGPLPTKTAIRKGRNNSDIKEPPRHCMAVHVARYVGEPVAFVVAESQEIANNALDLIEIDYETLNAITNPIKALEEGAPQIWDDIPNNLCLDFDLGNEETTMQAMLDADHVVTLDIENNRVTAVPIEPRGCVGSYDSNNETFTLFNSTQNIHANRDTFAENVLGIDKEKLHHIAPDIGGGFGVKNSAYPEPPLVLYAAKQLERPVKWINSRSDSFLSDTHGRGQTSRVKLALNKDGKFLALHTETVGAIGAYCWTVGPFTPTGGSARTQGGPYAFPTMYYRGRAVFTNTAPMDPYRGAGRPEATFQTERIIEYAARKLGFDPIEIRRKNLITPEALPHKTPMGLNIDSGNFPHLFEKILDMAKFSDLLERKKKAKQKGLLFGFAISPYLECTGGGPKEFAGINFFSDGSVKLAVGSQSTGMGHETSLPQLLASRLGIDYERIIFTQADTEATPIGGGHGGSRGMELGGNAINQAADEVIKKAKGLAAYLLQSDVTQISFLEGFFKVSASGASISMSEVIEASLDDDRLPNDIENGALNTGTIFERSDISIPNGCHAAAVEVDPETGLITLTDYWVFDDFGIIINPLLADGQVMGGVAQGIGQAILENIIYDSDSGQLVTGSLMDYGLPRADMIPNMDIKYYEGAPTLKNPLGVKGAGEAGCVGSLPTVVNAVLDALKDYGVIHIDMPMTPEKVWRAIQNQGKHDPEGLMNSII